MEESREKIASLENELEREFETKQWHLIFKDYEEYEGDETVWPKLQKWWIDVLETCNTDKHKADMAEWYSKPEYFNPFGASSRLEHTAGYTAYMDSIIAPADVSTDVRGIVTDDGGQSSDGEGSFPSYHGEVRLIPYIKFGGVN